MITIYIFSKFFHPVFKEWRKKLYVLWFLNNLNYLLYGPRPMSMSAQPDWIRFHILYYLCQLVIITALSYLLRQIIPERIIHYLDKRVNRVLKY